MPPPPYVNAPATRRGAGDPILHASHRVPVPVGAGDRYRALCGRTVAAVTTVPWNPRGAGRLCPECVNETIRRAEVETEPVARCPVHVHQAEACPTCATLIAAGL